MLVIPFEIIQPLNRPKSAKHITNINQFLKMILKYLFNLHKAKLATKATKNSIVVNLK
jgi:hypothetical protein